MSTRGHSLNESVESLHGTGIDRDTIRTAFALLQVGLTTSSSSGAGFDGSRQITIRGAASPSTSFIHATSPNARREKETRCDWIRFACIVRWQLSHREGENEITVLVTRIICG